MRKALVVLGLVFATLSTSTATGFAEPEVADWPEVRVPGTHFHMRYPPTWERLPNDQMRANFRQYPQATPLVMVVGNGGFSSLVVDRFRGKYASWTKDFADAKRQSRKLAALSHGTLLRVSKAKVGPFRGYRYMDQSPDPTSGAPFLYSQIELRLADKSVVDFVVSVEATSGARRLVDEILDSVKMSAGD